MATVDSKDPCRPTTLSSHCQDTDSAFRSPDSSPDTSPTSGRPRPLTAMAWGRPQSYVSPRMRPSTAIGWESKRSMGGKWEGQGRRYSTGMRAVHHPSPWVTAEGGRARYWNTTRGGGGGERSGSQSSDDIDGWVSLKSSQAPPCKDSLLDLVQSNKKKKDKFQQLVKRLMLESSSGVNCTGEHNMTPFHLAVLNGDRMCVEALIAFGANINAKNSYNQTPLDIASENQRGRDIPEVSSQQQQHHPSTTTRRRRAVSSPHEEACCGKLHSPETAPRRKPSAQHCQHHTLEYGSACSGDLSDCELTERMEVHIDRRFEASQSLKPDEAFAIALQKREIAKYKSKCSPLTTRSITPAPSANPMIQSVGGNRILSLDGGGVRALIQIDILCEIERLTGKRVTQLFDWIIGSSAGGIVALALVYKQMSLSRVRSLYFRMKEEVFSKGRVGFCYDTVRLEELLKESLGTDVHMGDVTHPKVLVCAVDKSNIPLKLNFFNNCFDDEFSQQLVWKVARYTSAAPMYFTECDNYVDGGVICNNPCINGLNKIQSFYKERGVLFPISCVVSLGSGICPTQELGPVDFHVFLRLKFAGMLKKAQSLITMLSSAIGESEALADSCRTSCAHQNIPFFRFNPQLGEKIGPGLTDNHKLIQMLITTRIYTHTQQIQLQQMLHLLLRNADLAR